MDLGAASVIAAAIVGVPAWVAAVNSVQANKAVNHKPKGEPTLYQHAAAVSAGLVELDLKVERYVSEDAAAHEDLKARLGRIERQR